MTLKRARRRAQAIANKSAATQPKLLAACRLATYSTSAGATPKSTKSASEFEFRAEARRSLQSACDSAVEAVKHGRPGDRAHRPFDRPLHRQADRGQAEAEREQRDKVGDQEPERHRPETATPRSCDARDRLPWRGGGLVHASAPLKGRRLDLGRDLRDHRLAGDGAAIDADYDVRARRQVDVDARAEADEADALARRKQRALVRETHDPPGDQAGDLHHAKPPGRGVDDDAVAPLSWLALSRSALRKRPG